jgi:hypothetical protein
VSCLQPGQAVCGVLSNFLAAKMWHLVHYATRNTVDVFFSVGPAVLYVESYVLCVTNSIRIPVLSLL